MMAKRKIGRNDPCPCDSGLKYKKCCLGRKSQSSKSGGAAEPQAEIDRPLEQFVGLSSTQLHRLLKFPFDSSELVCFPESLAGQPEAPIVTLFTLLIEAIGEKGLKPTAKGNLPQKFCREAALVYRGQQACGEGSETGTIYKEQDFLDLHVTRLMAERADLIGKQEGRFVLSDKCRTLIAQGGMAAVYPLLLRTGAVEFSWGCRDRYQELPFMQYAFLFSLYLLSRFGNDWQSATFYQDHFLRAFPLLIDEMKAPGSEISPEQALRSCYTLRTLDHFAGFFGLVTLEPTEGKEVHAPEYRLRKTPLFDQAVQFSL